MRSLVFGLLGFVWADTCPEKMVGLSCFGSDQDLTSVSSSSYEDCCSKCSQNSDCTAFTFSNNKCELKRYCRNLKKDRMSSTSTSGVFPSGRPPKFCSGKDMYLGAGYKCTDSTVKSVSNIDEGECCDQCQATSGCNYYSYNTKQSVCEMKGTCRTKTRASGYNTGFMPPAEPDTFKYNVGQGSYTVSGYKCGNRDGTTLVFFPDGEGPFKVALYAHGLGGYLDHGTDASKDGLDEWMKIVASVGFIVIVPFTGGGSCPKEYIDMLQALKYSKENSPHPIFKKADWSGVGVWGHSMGGAAAPRIAEHGAEYGINVTAMVGSHGAGTSASLENVPSLFTTGTLDTKDHDDDGNKNYFYSQYKVCRGRPKYFVNLQDGYHMEPLEGKRLNYLTAQFFACHVQGDQQHCNYIDSQVCNRKDLAVCERDDSPAPSPSPRPSPTPTPSPSPTPTNCGSFRQQQQCKTAGCKWCKTSWFGTCQASCSFDETVSV